MCLSTVIKKEGDAQTELCNMISNAKVDGSTLIFTDVMGTETKVRGRIDGVDLVGNKIFVTTDN